MGEDIHHQQAGDDAIQIGRARDVTLNLVTGITRLPTDYASRIQNFLNEYVGTPEQPVPFGGRNADLDRLDTWLADPHGSPYLLLAAPAGRGKSALLVRWSQRLLTQNDASLVFVPVSIRFRTNLASVVFAALAARLAHLHREEVPQSTDLTAEQWRGLVSTYLARTPPDGRSLLLILDGLDEAADWEPGPDLFPLAPPPGLRVIVSARYQASDADAGPWLRRLGWERPGLARPLDLAPLAQDGVADVLQKMGFPLDVLARDVDIVTELHRLSEGDPLLVRLYVDDLWARGEAAARLRPENLRAIRPGLKGYLDRWWEDQRRLWGADAPLKEPTVQALLNLLTCALGPLGQEDVLALAGEVGLTTWKLEEALRPLARFVFGDGKTQGYVFGHPRLGEYFYERLIDAERLAWEQRFLDWGRQTVTHLEARTLAPGEVPAYLVQYYGTHLERVGGLAEFLFALVNDGWRRAWEALEGAYGGFLTDVERAWRAAELINGIETAKGRPAPHLGVEVRSALCCTSVNSLAQNIPPELLVALVEQGTWTSAQGLAYAWQVPEPRQRAAALARLSLHLPEADRAEALWEVWTVIREIRDEDKKVEALAGLAPHLPESLLREALTAALEIRDEDKKVKALTGLDPYLPEPLLREVLAAARKLPEQDRTGRSPRAEALAGLAPHLPELLVQEALAAVHEIQDEHSQERALVRLAPHLPEPLLREVLAQCKQAFPAEVAKLVPRLAELGYCEKALASVQEIEGHYRAEALARLAPHLSEPLLQKALAMAQELPEEDWAGASPRAKALAGLAPYLPEPLKRESLQEALVATRALRNQIWRAWGLAGLASHLPEPLLRETLVAAREIEDEFWRVDALTGLAPHLPEPLLREALAAAREIRQSDNRARVLAALAPHLTEPLLRKALAAAREIQDENEQAKALAGLIPRLAEVGYTVKALAVAQEIGNGYYRSKALAGLASYLPEPLKGEALLEALAVARALRSGIWLTRALAGLAPHLAEPLLREVLATAQEIWDRGDRAVALTGLAPHLEESLLWEALTVAREIEDENEQAKALAGLVPRLAELGYAVEALAIAQEIGNEHHRSRALVGLAPHLPEPLFREALTTAQEIQHGSDRERALAGLAPRLTELGYPLEALVVAQEVEEYYRADALTGLAPHLEESLLWEALTVAREIEDENEQAKALAGLVPRLAELGYAVEALAMAQEIGNEHHRSRALVGLAPHLSEPLLQKALITARAIENQWRRADALARLVPRLAELGYHEEALAVARVIENQWRRADALARLASHLAQLPHQHLYPLWQETLHLLAARTRRDLLADLCALSPVITALGGTQAIVETVHAIQDVGRWWP